MYDLRADPAIDNMMMSNDIILDNGNRQKTLTITVPPGVSEIIVTCTATRTGVHESANATLMIQGELENIVIT